MPAFARLVAERAISARREGRDAATMQRKAGERLSRLVAYARRHSAYYAERYRSVAANVRDPRELPATTKQDLMERFDEWVCDPSLTLARIEPFLADARLSGQKLAGAYYACTTSGVTGRRGVFVHDAGAVATYAGLGLARGLPRWLGEGRGAKLARRGFRIAALVAAGGPYAAITGFQAARNASRRVAAHVRVFDVIDPLPRLLDEIQRYQPTILAGYPSALSLLAREQARGSLVISPVLCVTGGEWLAPTERVRIEEALGAPVRDAYAASEFPALAFDCGRGSLHANADHVLLEPVDANGEPTPAGRASATTYVTNLANHIQPILRVELGDSVTLRDAPCPCGSALPALRVEGRRDELLRLREDAREVPILPLALASIIEETPGLRRFQAYQSGPLELKVRIETGPDADRAEVWGRVEARVATFLAAQGAPHARVQPDSTPPHRDARSGKYREVWTQWRP